MNNWFKHFISVDEARISSLIIALFGFGGLAVYCVIHKGDLPANLASIIIALIITIGGINAANYLSANMAIKSSVQPTNQTMMPTQTNMYGMNGMYGSNYGMGYGTSMVTTQTMNNGMVVNNNQTTTPPQQMPIVNTGTQTKI